MGRFVLSMVGELLADASSTCSLKTLTLACRFVRLVIERLRRGGGLYDERRVASLFARWQNALRTAMSLEKIPATDFNDLRWIMAQESSGRYSVHLWPVPHCIASAEILGKTSLVLTK